MRGRETKGPPSTDLLVCFPTRAHLTLMPKPICSPARPPDPNKHHHHHQTNHHHHHLRKLSSRGGGAGAGGGHASPLLWSKTKPLGPDISEPTSPKVTCAGQIKVRPKASCKNWQSVMEEIEKLHKDRKQKKKSSTWAETLGFKKDTMQFLTCLRRIRFDFRCFGSFPTPDLTSDEEEDDDEEEEEYPKKGIDAEEKGNENENSTTVFSKWFMVLQQEKNQRFSTKEQSEQRKQSREEYSDKEEPTVAPCGPPPNALLLMRCRSAPAKSWLEEREDEEREKQDEEEKKEKGHEVKKEEKRSRSLAVVMRSDADFYNISPEHIAKETWVVGGLRDAISRSRSWKR